MKNNDAISIILRQLEEEAAGSGRFKQTGQSVTWNPLETAAVICDMWDAHWCGGATARVAELAPRMNDLLKTLRNKGVSIIHAPSDTMAFYAGHPGRLLMQQAKRAYPQNPLPLVREIKEANLPIDDSDGGCACTPACLAASPWTRQIETIEIHDADGITDSDEIFYFLKDRQIKNVIIMGVHTNMCILGRDFAIRELVKRGLNVTLVRDMTDTMYNPARQPGVDHFTGTDLVIWHIEQYLCPTISSDQIMGGSPFRFNADTRATQPEYHEFAGLPAIG